MRRALRVGKNNTKPGALLNRMHQLKGMPKKKHKSSLPVINSQLAKNANDYKNATTFPGVLKGAVKQLPTAAKTVAKGIGKGAMELGKGAAQMAGVNMDWSPERAAVKGMLKHKMRKPKPQGKGIVKALGQSGTTGNFAKIEASKGKGAAIGALQNKLAARRGNQFLLSTIKLLVK